MGDKLRLMVTGVAAVGVVAVTVTGNGLWSRIFHADRFEQSVPLNQLRDFNGITLLGPDNVIVTSGPNFSVKTEGDADTLKRLALSVHDGALRISRRERSGWWGWGGHPATIRVTMPGLSRVWISGPGDVTADKTDAKEFAARLDGSGGIKVAALDANSVRLSLTGSGNMDLGGKTREISVELTGSGSVTAGALNAETANVSVTGSGEVQAHAAQSAHLTVHGSGQAQVAGTNRCQIDKTGSGDAECTS